MGCDIHSYAERKNIKGQWELIPNLSALDDRNYRIFGFLAGVRNYSWIAPIAELRGIPEDISTGVMQEYISWCCDAHSPSWLSMSELLAFKYDALCEDRRVMRQTAQGYWNGGCTCNPGEGKVRTYRAFLGEYFFEELERLQKAGAERIVFWFDN